MPKAKKKFIDRKNAVTFNLVHRSQRDPLVADETAPQRVLVPVNASIPLKKEKEPDLTVEQRREQQKKYGIYFDDDYNYLQHLKDTREVTMVLQPKTSHKGKGKVSENVSSENVDDEIGEKLQLPSSVFASEVEEDVGLLNKAASQGLCLQLDPDVVAALDEDFDFDDPDNHLEDNFIEMAMGEGEGDNDDGEDDYDDEGSISGDNSDNSDKAFGSDFDSDDDSDRSQERAIMATWNKEDDTKSRFSQYSMSSSVIRRNEGLSLLDNRFEKMFAEYDDTEVGALDLDEITGFLPESHHRLLEAAEEFEESRRRKELTKEATRMKYLQQITEESDEDLVPVDVDPKEKWDCETILSTYSNLYNHPKLIEEPKKPQKIKINTKTGIPEDTLGKDNKLTLKSLAKFNALNKNEDISDDERTNVESVLSTLSVLSLRPKDESPEEKKERKRLLKEYRKERRIEKKANKDAFKEEKKRQEKIMLNNRNNVQGNRIL